MQQCPNCSNKYIDESLKPFGDYFICLCSGTRNLSGFGPELEHWRDEMCLKCAKEKNCCRTCGDILPQENIDLENTFDQQRTTNA